MPKSSSLSSDHVSRLRPFLVLLALSGVLVGGCATGEYAMVVPIAGGGTARVPLSKIGVPMTSEDGIEITAAGITINPDKKPVYTLGFKDTRHRGLRQVRVEDVSDDAAITLVDETGPKSSAAGEWNATTDPMGVTDPRLKWLATVSNSTRVFRFTLTFADGRTQTLLQGMQIGAPTKAALRQLLGQNY